MNNFDIINSNSTKINDFKESLNKYYTYMNNSFLNGFSNESFNEFKSVKDFFDDFEIQLTNATNKIFGVFETEKRIKIGLEYLKENQKLLPYPDLSNLSSLRRIELPNNVNRNDNINAILPFLEKSINIPNELINAINEYNEKIMIFRSIQNNNYERYSFLSKALYNFFNYKPSSRKLREHIIKLNIQPLSFNHYGSEY